MVQIQTARQFKERNKMSTNHYVGLYGSFIGNWCEIVQTKLDDANIKYHNLISSEWNGITESNGDEKQQQIDSLVSQELDGILGASCVLLHLERQEKRNGQLIEATSLSLASHCEIGFLAGRKIDTFLHIEPDVAGRNYLWAFAKQHSAIITICSSLDEAIEQSINFMKNL